MRVLIITIVLFATTAWANPANNPGPTAMQRVGIYDQCNRFMYALEEYRSWYYDRGGCNQVTLKENGITDWSGCDAAVRKKLDAYKRHMVALEVACINSAFKQSKISQSCIDEVMPDTEGLFP